MIRNVFFIFTLLLICCNCGKEKDKDSPGFQVVAFDPLPVTKTNTMQLFVHYMPWFEDKSTSGTGNWGWHWTMNNRNPDIIDGQGKREIASHYYPLIGPYASSDPDLIEYHLLLMKYSGIDGILIDWYGSSDAVDYGTNRRNTEALIAMLDKTGMKFAIVYEDATIPKVMEATGSTDGRSLARRDMLYLQQHYFNQECYIKINGKPLLMVFGPNYFSDAADWESIFTVFTTKPCFMPLWNRSSSTGSASSGEYIWVDQVNTDDKYATAGNFQEFIGGAWPGFHDFYKEGNAGNTLFIVDHDNGNVWSSLLSKASQYNMEYLQLITWNDFGEGTMIEPTLEFGNDFLNALQQFAGVEYSDTELDYIRQQYELRKTTDTPDLKFLDQAFYYWVSLQHTKAIRMVDSLTAIN